MAIREHPRRRAAAIRSWFSTGFRSSLIGFWLLTLIFFSSRA
jgi:hypothetical protein